MDKIKFNKENKNKIEEINEFYNNNSKKLSNKFDEGDNIFTPSILDKLFNTSVFVILIISLILFIFVTINII